MIRYLHIPLMALWLVLIGAACTDEPESFNGAYEEKSHLLISELLFNETENETGDDAEHDEFIEILNPTAQSINLGDYYLSDVPEYYYRLPEGYQLTSFFEWIMRLPEVTLAAGERIVVCYDGSDTGAFGAGNTYEGLCDISYTEEGTPATGVEQSMSIVDIGQSTIPSMIDDGETIVLFYWDGSSDRVKDVDIVFLPESSSAINPIKTGVDIDGPDKGNTKTEYEVDAGTYEEFSSTVDAGFSITRKSNLEKENVDLNSYADFTETYRATGNGITGHDETKENTADNFTIEEEPTPGT